MKRYAVVFEESAQSDVRANRMIGVDAPGASTRPNNGFANCAGRFSERLAVVPKALLLAPEDDEFVEEIRQLVVGRYRILFTIKGRKVHVLHVRGAYPAD